MHSEATTEVLFTLPKEYEISVTHSKNTNLLLKSFEAVARNYVQKDLWQKISSAQKNLFTIQSNTHISRNLDQSFEALQELTTNEIKIAAEVYTTLFHLLNISEEVEIVLINRARSKDGSRKGSIVSAISDLAKSGKSSEDMNKILESMQIEPTFTAHPTEARRPSIVRKMHKIAQELLKGEAADENEIHNLIASLFATPEHRSQTPTVIDEVRYGIGLTANSLWEIVPKLSNEILKALTQHYPGITFNLPMPLKFRTWIGGDRDGNVKVTASTTEQTLQYQRIEAINKQIENIKELYDSRALVLDSSKVPASDALKLSVQKDYVILGISDSELPEDSALPYHAKLRLVLSKLKNLLDGKIDLSLYKASDFIDDLRIIKYSLQNSELGMRVSQTLNFQNTIIRAEVFGFHLQTLDLRQHTEIHNRSVASIIKLLPSCIQNRSLEEHIIGVENLEIDESLLNAEAIESLNVFRVAKEAIERDPKSIKCFIMSMTTTPDDFLKTLFLMKYAGLWRIKTKDLSGQIQSVESDLDVVPLFETITDLTKASGILTHILKSRAYQLQIAARNNHQEIMLGYSDSNKDGGYFMANLKLHIAMRQISKTLIKYGINFSFFHGRGGTVARGGGRAHEAILATPEESRSYKIRMTEQGEVISTRYGVPEIAHRHLEQIVNAMLLVHHEHHKIPKDLSREALSITQSIGKVSMRRYREFVRAKNFWEDYTTVTPIHFLGRLKNASRAVFRNISDNISKLNDLRAIPWVFSWIQTRLCLPGWYGLGAGLHNYLYLDHASLNKERLHKLQNAYDKWGFFALIIDNANRELARTRLEIGARYLGLGKNYSDLYETIRSDYQSAKDAVLMITKSTALLENEPKIVKLIKYRNELTDLLNLCQIVLLKRHSSGNEEVTEAMLHVTSGLVAAMQSSG